METLNIESVLNIYDKLTNFSIDELEEEANEAIPSESDFFSLIYVDRELYHDFKSELFKNPNKLLCLVGPKGSGKSTILSKLTHELKKDAESIVFYIDIRKEIENINEDIQQKTRNVINNYYLKYSRTEIWDKENFEEISKFYSFLLDFYNPKNNKKIKRPDYLFHCFEPLIKSATILKNKTKYSDLQEWLANNLMPSEDSQDGFDDFFKELDEKVNFKHLAYFLENFHGKTRQVVIIDNIDKLPDVKQVQLVNLLSSFKQTTPNLISYIIAVREENVFMVDETLDFDVFPQRHVKICLENPDLSNEAPKYNYIGVPVDDNRTTKKKSSLVRKVIDKRFQYIENKYFNIDFESFYKIKMISNSIIQAFETEKIILLSNNSLRNLLPLHSEFLIDLVVKNGIDEAINLIKEKWFLRTILLHWVTQRDAKYYGDVFDIVYYSENQLNRKEITQGCFLPYLVITTILNLKNNQSIKRHHNHYNLPKIGDIVKKLTFLGFVEDEIKDTIFHLYKHERGYNNYINIQTNNTISNSSEIYDDFRVRVTYRGKVCIGRIWTSFGYILSLVYDYKKIKSPLNKTSFHDGTLILPFLANIASVHLKSLNYIRINSYNKRATWLNEYYENYAILLDPECARIVRCGRKYHGGNRALFFELLIHAIIPYFNERIRSGQRVQEIKKSLERMLNRYSKIINDLGNNIEIVDAELEIKHEP